MTNREADVPAADSPPALLARWLRRQLDPAAWAWLDERRASLATGYADRTLHIAIGMAPRKLGKADLALDDEARAAAAAHDGWNPAGWSVSDAARVLLLLETAHSGNVPFAERFTDLCRTADVGELMAFYRGLPLYPTPDALAAQAAEGLRSNMRAVYEAVAHDNPYPRRTFDESRWNHMVLKALFVGSRLAPIDGLDERANADLAEMLCDYAHERWAAGRDVTFELWRCVGPFATGAMLDDLTRALKDGADADREAAPLERKGAALALHASPSAESGAIVESEAPDLAAAIAAGTLDWRTLG